MIRFLPALMLCIFLSVLPQNLYAQRVTAPSDSLELALADKYVDITTNFSGRSVVVFGVNESGGELVVTLTGPEAYTVMRKKGQALGIWVNVKAFGFKDVPLYYDYALNADEAALGSVESLRLDGVGVNSMQYDARSRATRSITGPFHEALIRRKQQADHYAYDAKKIEYIGDKLFKVTFKLPADVPTGEYTVKAMVYKGRLKAAEKSEYLQVRQVGFSAKLYSYAHNHSFFYGLAVVLFAVISGYGAHAILGRR